MAIIRVRNNDVFRWWSIGISSIDDDCKQATIDIRGFGKSLSINVPNWLIPPVKVKHQYFNKEDNAIRTYWTNEIREYSICVFEDHFSVHYGLQSHDSSTEQSWGCTIPFATWRFVRHSVYALDHTHFGVVSFGYATKLGTKWKWSRDEHNLRDQVPKIKFAFKDFDGEEGIATCYIEEREWRFGEGMFRWLSVFRQPIIRRDLNIEYDIEVGKEKGSYKGGIIGCSCDIAPWQAPIEAFRAHCLKYNLTYQGRD